MDQFVSLTDAKIILYPSKFPQCLCKSLNIIVDPVAVQSLLDACRLDESHIDGTPECQSTSRF